jgi:hypothetical protein
MVTAAGHREKMFPDSGYTRQATEHTGKSLWRDGSEEHTRKASQLAFFGVFGVFGGFTRPVN